MTCALSATLLKWLDLQAVFRKPLYTYRGNETPRKLLFRNYLHIFIAHLLIKKRKKATSDRCFAIINYINLPRCLSAAHQEKFPKKQKRSRQDGTHLGFLLGKVLLEQKDSVCNKAIFLCWVSNATLAKGEKIRWPTANHLSQQNKRDLEEKESLLLIIRS